jgi:Cu2+-exporting ATPase
MVAIAPVLDAALDPSPFVERKANGEASLELLVTGAHCANCIAKIESSVGRLKGVTGARLNLSTGKLSVRWRDGAIKPLDIAQSVCDLGFGVRPFAADTALETNKREGVFLLQCLAVSGFGTTFVVGLTDALYYSSDLSPAMHALFNWIAACIAVPATMYASRPFFRSALAALKAGRGNMDVPISLSLVLTLLLSFYQTVSNGRLVYFDAAVMLCFTLLIGRYLDFRLRNRARGAAAELLSMQTVSVRKHMPSGNFETVAANALVPGDRILLSSGERSPVDGTLVCDTEADVSLVTGESNPVSLHQGEMLYAGSIVTGAAATLAVTAPAGNSLIAELARILDAGQQSRNRYVRLADRAANLYVPLVHGLALSVFVAWLAVAPFTTALTNAITILIVTCPCALGLAVPAVQIVASSRLFRRGLLIKSGDALERLADIDLAVFDKTGTLTGGKPQLIGSAIDPQILERAAQLARISRHPLALALGQAAGDGPIAESAVEIPAQGIIEDDTDRRLGKAEWVGVPAGKDGFSELWYRDRKTPPVRFTFADMPRNDAAETARAFEQRGIACMILSGDRREAVASAAEKIGITDWRAEADPKTKANILETLRGNGRKVLMVGDGLNDAAALAAAHVSIAPASGMDATQMAADMVLRSRGLYPLVEAVDVARRAKSLVLQNLGFAATYNAIVIPVAALGYVTPLIASLAMAASSLLVTLNALRANYGGQA